MILSKKNKQLLIDYVRQNLTVNTLCSRDNISNPVYIFKYKNYHPIFIKHMLDWVKANYTYEPEDFTEAITSERPYKTDFYKMVDDREKHLLAHVYCINKLFDDIPIDEFKFKYNQTDYKPCHNILIEIGFKNPERCWINTTNIQIRTSDFPFNEGECYGRNTRNIKSYKLTDINFKKYCDKLGIKLPKS